MDKDMWRRRGFLPAVAVLLAWALPGPVASQEPVLPLTAAERSDYRQTTRYDELVSFLEQIAAGHPRIQLTTMGTTSEGRAMPLVVVGSEAGASADAVRATGKTRLYLQGGIHAGEISGKEALLILLREIAEGEHAHWTDSLVLLINPLYNADGNEKVSPENRPRQHGPVEGMGQRANAMGLDLNRDQMKLDAPESRALVGLYTDYDPHLSVDLHTTNGTRHGYHLTYAPPLPPSTPPEIDGFLRERWLPEVTRSVKEDTGWDMYYYGDARQPRGGGEGGWYTFSHQPRYVSNYIGLRNRFGILGEAYSYASFKERIEISYAFSKEIIEFAYRNASTIARLTAEAEGHGIVGGSLGVRAEPQRSAEPVEILMGEVVEETNPVSGQTMWLRTDTQTPTPMYEYGTFRPTEWEKVPEAYLLPPGMDPVLDLLDAHGVKTVAVHQAPPDLRVQTFQIDSLSTSEREYQGHNAQEVWGRYGPPEPVDIEEGSVMVPMDQPLARVVFALLEPRSDDGLVAWGLLTEWLAPDRPYPVRRVPSSGRPAPR